MNTLWKCSVSIKLFFSNLIYIKKTFFCFTCALYIILYTHRRKRYLDHRGQIEEQHYDGFSKIKSIDGTLFENKFLQLGEFCSSNVLPNTRRLWIKCILYCTMFRLFSIENLTGETTGCLTYIINSFSVFLLLDLGFYFNFFFLCVGRCRL